MIMPHDDTASLTDFYGPPGTPSNMVLVAPPWQMTYEGRPVRGVQIHHKLAASLREVFEDIAAQIGRDWTRLPPGAVKFSGSYNYRPIRGSSRASCHAFGAAIDMDAEDNPMNTRGNRGTMSALVINAFKRQGWFWGGDFKHRQDPMHFQAANEGPVELEVMDMGEEDRAGFMENVLFEANPTQTATVEAQGSQLVSSTAPLGTQGTPAEAPPGPPSMLTSKTGWAAIGLGGSGALDGLNQANAYAAQISTAKFNLQQLNVADVCSWLIHHPIVFLPVVVIAAACFVWEDHKKYKRLLHEAQKR
jgi:hypothetical protein